MTSDTILTSTVHEHFHLPGSGRLHTLTEVPVPESETATVAWRSVAIGLLKERELRD